jgi:hypothetical protein
MTKRNIRGMLLALLVSLGLLVAPGASQAAVEPTAYPIVPFTLAYGNSVLTGTLTWYNRSIGVAGSITARSTAKQGWFWGTSADGSCNPEPQTRTTPLGTTRPFNFTMNCDVVGGFEGFYVVLRDEFYVLVRNYCTRLGCYRY